MQVVERAGRLRFCSTASTTDLGGGMVRVNFVSADGQTFAVDAVEGDTAMRAAVDNLVPGIVAECGGTCSCATCHCYVERPWFDGLDDVTDTEQDMMSLLEGRRENSRLSCQIELTDDLDGIVISLPASQHEL